MPFEFKGAFPPAKDFFNIFLVFIRFEVVAISLDNSVVIFVLNVLFKDFKSSFAEIDAHTLADVEVLDCFWSQAKAVVNDAFKL